jgi:PleD family two-component response regulator
MGVASLPGDGNDARSLMAAADRALYRAKQGGKNRVEAAPVAEADGPQGNPPIRRS